MRLQDEGACFVYCKSTKRPYLLPRADYARIKAEWMAGRAFYEGSGFYGSPLTLKLGDVVGLINDTPQAMKAAQADYEEGEEEDKFG